MEMLEDLCTEGIEDGAGEGVGGEVLVVVGGEEVRESVGEHDEFHGFEGGQEVGEGLL